MRRSPPLKRYRALLLLPALLLVGCERLVGSEEAPPLPPPESVVPSFEGSTADMVRERLVVDLAGIRRRLASGGVPIFECRSAGLLAAELRETGDHTATELLEFNYLCGREVPMAAVSEGMFVLDENVTGVGDTTTRRAIICAGVRQAVEKLDYRHGAEPGVKALLDRYRHHCP